MIPTLLDLPRLGIVVRPADVSVVLAIVFALWLGPRWAEALEGVDRRAVRRALLVLAVVTLVGGRVHYLINSPGALHGSILDLVTGWPGRMHIPGGIAALALAAPFVTRRFGVPVGKFGDGFAPTLGLAIAITRVGCFVQGCCYGTPCAYSWCVTFPSGSLVFQSHLLAGLVTADAARSLPVHPVQLYLAASGLLVTAASLWVRRRKRYDGQAALVALFVFSSVSVTALQFFRAELSAAGNWGPLPQLTWAGIAMSVATLAVLGAASSRDARRSAAALPVPSAGRT